MNKFIKRLVVPAMATAAVMGATQSFAFDLFDVLLPPGLSNVGRNLAQQQIPVPPPGFPPIFQQPGMPFNPGQYLPPGGFNPGQFVPSPFGQFLPGQLPVPMWVR